MKKLLLTAMLIGAAALANATTINAPSSLTGVNVLDGNNAYTWGISIPLANGQTITSAQIDFVNVTLTAANSSGTGRLYTDLLKSTATGVHSASDGDAAGDYWATKYSGANISQLGSQFFSYVGKTLSWSIVLNSTQLAALNSYLAAGTFNIGIDPDCHFTVGNITFTYTTSTTTVPDVATTACLFLLGLAGLEVFRRQLVAAKSKA